MSKDHQQVDGAWFAGSGEKLDIDNAYGISVGYQSPDVLFGPIGIRLGYAGAQFQDEGGMVTPSNPTGDEWLGDATAAYDKYNQYAASIYWGNLNAVSGPFIAAMYQVRDFTMKNGFEDYKVQGAEFMVGYGFECGVSIRTGYQWLNNDPDNEQVSGYKNSDAHIIPVYVNYDVSPNFNVWAEARFDAGTDDDFVDDSLTENTYSVGARYTF